MRCSKWMIAICVVPTMKHWRGGVMVWGCYWHCWWFIQNSRHTYPAFLAQHSAVTHHPSGLHLVGPSFVSQQDKNPKHTSRLCKGYLTKRESDGVLASTITQPKPNLEGLRWAGLQSEGKAANKCSAYVRTSLGLLEHSRWPPHDAVFNIVPLCIK